MPAIVRGHVSHTTPPRPYDRRSPTASPHLSRSLPPASSIQALDGNGDAPPDHPGLPTYAEYKRIESGYLHSLSPRKRDKALITQAMFDKIWDVLHQPEACTVETPQFRFWVRKMFTLSRPARVFEDAGDGGWGWGEERAGGAGTGTGTGTHPVADSDSDAEEAALELERSMRRRCSADELSFTAVVLHENRPVAILEQLYELFCYCHVRAGHGGRDKTCAVIREHYSWVPKELTAQFVKACPTCVLKRSGQAHGVGVDVGVLAHRRVVGRRGRRGRVAPLEVGVEEMPVPVEPLGLGWPTTGGPLDPEPCGVREREQEQEWLRARGDVGTIGLPSPVSPARGSRTRGVPREARLENCSPGRWNSIPRASTLNASPFHLCDTTRSEPGHPFAVNNGARRSDQEQEKRSPTKTGLPSLASALSNESLDENVNLTGLGPGDTAGECPLPPVLRPLRLLGPVPSDPESDPDRSSYPLQIDPVLLSFSYPGLDLSSEPGFASDAGVDGSLEHAVSYTTVGGAATLPSSLSTEFTARRQCGSRYGHRDGPFYHSSCSADEVGRELDGPLSFSIVNGGRII